MLFQMYCRRFYFSSSSPSLSAVLTIAFVLTILCWLQPDPEFCKVSQYAIKGDFSPSIHHENLNKSFCLHPFSNLRQSTSFYIFLFTTVVLTSCCTTTPRSPIPVFKVTSPLYDVVEHFCSLSMCMSPSHSALHYRE